MGKNIDLCGVGIGCVLEPLQAGPTMISDNCFIGTRSEVVVIEGYELLKMLATDLTMQ